MLPLLAALLLLADPIQPADLVIAGEHFAAADILDARAVPDVSGSAGIMITLGESAAKRLATLTAARAGKPVAFVVDGRTLAEPIVREPIAGGVVEISGPFALREAQALAKRVSGKDPLPDSLEE